jgi:uncharacterized protein YjbJ (UPF0337 family)
MRGSQDKVKGNTTRLKGKAQHAWGELTANPDLIAKGRANKAKGKSQRFGGRVKNAIGALKG